MSFAKFCPRCGKDTNSFIGNICTDCFLQDKKIFEVGKISIFVCKFCNRLFISNNEVAFSEEVIGEEVASKTTVIPELGEPKIFVELIKRTDLDYEAIVNVKGLIKIGRAHV
mgnify:FL=1